MSKIIFYEENWRNECSAKLKPTFYKVYSHMIISFLVHYLESAHSFLGYICPLYTRT